MHKSQKQHYCKLVKDTFGCGKLGSVMNVGFTVRQQDCLYDEIIASD